MNAELPSFKNGEHNSESVSTIDRGLTPFTRVSIQDIFNLSQVL